MIIGFLQGKLVTAANLKIIFVLNWRKISGINKDFSQLNSTHPSFEKVTSKINNNKYINNIAEAQ